MYSACLLNQIKRVLDWFTVGFLFSEFGMCMWTLNLNSRLSLLIRMSFSRGSVVGGMKMWPHWHLLRTVIPMGLSVARKKEMMNSIFKQEMNLYLVDFMDPMMEMVLEQSESMWIQSVPGSESYHRSENYRKKSLVEVQTLGIWTSNLEMTEGDIGCAVLFTSFVFVFMCENCYCLCVIFDQGCNIFYLKVFQLKIGQEAGQ